MKEGLMTSIQPASTLPDTLSRFAPRLRDKIDKIMAFIHANDWVAKPYVSNDELTCAVQKVGDDFFIHLNRHKRFEDPLISPANSFGTRVRLCINVKTAEVVVVKRLLLAVAHMKELFENEKQLQNFDNPSIIRLRFAATIHGKENALKGFLGLEYCSRGDVVDYIDTLQVIPFPPPFLQPTMFSLLQAVVEIHARGLVHGDIKPDNIFINEKLEAKLADFGFCAEAGKTVGIIRCTLNCLAPEVAQLWLNRENIVPTKEADMWAVGCVLYSLISQQLPFWFVKGAENDVGKVVSNIVGLKQKLPLWLQQTRELYPGEFFIELLCALLEVDPSRRITAADALSKVKNHMEAMQGSLSR